MRNGSRWLLGLTLVVMARGLTGCAGFFVKPIPVGTTPGTPTGGPSYAYVANATTSTVAGYGLETGALVAVAGSPYALPQISPTCLVVTPANTFLYVGGTGAIFGYAIGASGQLTAIGTGAALAAPAAVSMDVSPDGGWLLVLDGSGVTVDVYQINTTTGALSSVSVAAFAVAGGATLPREIKFVPNGALVFAAMGTGGDVGFTFNTTTGELKQTQTLAGSAVTSDNGLAVDGNSAFLYVARSGTGAGVAIYQIGAAGALTAVTGSPFVAGTAPYSVALSTTGTDLYVGGRSDGTISGFSVASGGGLTALGGSPYANGSVVTELGRDSTGKYLVAASFSGAPDLTMYRYDATVAGKLDSVSTSAAGTDPAGTAALAMTH